jgi:hypothetical protein
MIIIMGVRMAGKVDAVPRVGHVATKFIHLYYVPLIPLGTFLVKTDAAGAESEQPLPMNGKSILVGWLRTVGWVVLLAGGVAAVLGVVHRDPGRVAVGLIGALVAGIFVLLLYRLRFVVHAGYERALEIARQAGLPPEEKLMLEVAYGRLNADQAERELLRLYEGRQQPVPGSAVSSLA